MNEKIQTGPQREMTTNELKEKTDRAILLRLRNAVEAGEITVAYNLSVMFSNLRD